MSYEQITTETADGVLTITMNRPDRLNAWTPTMNRELIAAFDEADAHAQGGGELVDVGGRGGGGGCGGGASGGGHDLQSSLISPGL